MKLKDAKAAKRKGRRPALPPFLKPLPKPVVRQPAGDSDVLALAHPDWLHQVVTFTGPADQVKALEIAAAGSGVVPWIQDYDRMEESWFLWLMSQRETLHTSKHLARQLRELAMEKHETAVSYVGMLRNCPFDLHSLVPVPSSILRLGEDDPKAKAWMWENWGTTWPLRYVERRPVDHSTFQVAFWSADWTPWQALGAIMRRWPGLTMQVKDDYGT